MDSRRRYLNIIGIEVFVEMLLLLVSLDSCGCMYRHEGVLEVDLSVHLISSSLGCSFSMVMCEIAVRDELYLVIGISLIAFWLIGACVTRSSSLLCLLSALVILFTLP